MTEPIPRRFVWIACNAAGIFAFLLLASLSWTEPELANIPGASGGQAFVWLLTAVPVFATFALLNLFVAVLALKRLITRTEWQATVIVAVTLSAWVAAYFFDNAHHGI